MHYVSRIRGMHDILLHTYSTYKYTYIHTSQGSHITVPTCSTHNMQAHTRIPG